MLKVAQQDGAVLGLAPLLVPDQVRVQLVVPPLPHLLPRVAGERLRQSGPVARPVRRRHRHEHRVLLRRPPVAATCHARPRGRGGIAAAPAAAAAITDAAAAAAAAAAPAAITAADVSTTVDAAAVCSLPWFPAGLPFKAHGREPVDSLLSHR